jgi:hypothetical protein
MLRSPAQFQGLIDLPSMNSSMLKAIAADKKISSNEHLLKNRIKFFDSEHQKLLKKIE